MRYEGDNDAAFVLDDLRSMTALSSIYALRLCGVG